MKCKTVVIVGCGFGGTAVIRRLAGVAASQLRLVAFDTQSCLYNYPVLPRLLNESIPPDKVEVPLSGLMRRAEVDLRRERVSAIDVDRQCVRSEQGETGYDYLVLALGSRARPLSQDDGIFVIYPKALRHLRYLRERIEEVIHATAPGDHANNDIPHRVAVVGGGLAGVEFAMAIREAVDRIGNAGASEKRRVEISLLERAHRLDPRGSENVSSRLARELARAGIRALVNHDVYHVSRAGLVTNVGLEPADTVVCCAGSQPNVRADFIAGLEHGAGIEADAMLRCRGLENTFVIGDCMRFRQHSEPPLNLHQAHYAMAQGRHVARNILRLARGREPKRYRPRESPVFVMLRSQRGVFGYRSLCTAGALSGAAKRWLEMRPG